MLKKNSYLKFHYISSEFIGLWPFTPMLSLLTFSVDFCWNQIKHKINFVFDFLSFKLSLTFNFTIHLITKGLGLGNMNLYLTYEQFTSLSTSMGTQVRFKYMSMTALQLLGETFLHCSIFKWYYFQSRKLFYNHQCLFVSLSVCYQTPPASQNQSFNLHRHLPHSLSHSSLSSLPPSTPSFIF